MRTRIALVLLLTCILAGWGSAAAQYTQVVLVLWHGAEPEDLFGLAPHLPQAWGLMNTRPGGGAGVEGAYLSLASGARAVGVAGAGAVFDSSEEHAYALNTGLEPWAVVQPDMWRIHSGQNTNYTVRPGALGTALQAEGKWAAAFGNSDTDTFVRWAGTVAVDEVGRAREGRVGKAGLVRDAGRPFGVRTDYQVLLDEVTGSTAPLVVVDLGDPYRFDAAAAALFPDQYEQLRGQMVAEARGFLNQLLEALPEQSAIMVVSPHPGREKASQNLWISPVVFFGGQPGLLVSPTTKWPGIITNMDVAPSVLKLLGLDVPVFMVGEALAVVPSPAEAAQAETAKLAKRLVWLSTYRGPVLRGLVGVQIGVYLAALAVMALDMPPLLRLVRLIQFLLILALAVPAYLLVVPGGIWPVLALTAVFGLIKLLTRNWLWVVAGVGLGTFALVAVDTLTGSFCMRFSFLGYDPIGGARFYGLGNEYMGIMIGALIMGWVCLAQLTRLSRERAALAALPLFAFTLAVVAAPWWGTNVGGAITAVLGFGATYGALRRVGRGWLLVIGITAALLVVLGSLMLIDARRPLEEQSHIGRTVTLMGAEGAAAVYNIIQRKLAMNLRLIRYSIWSRAWIAALGLMGASFIRPSRFTAWLAEKYPLIASGIWGTVVAGTAALAFNDSGVVAAATCVFFAATTMAVLALEYRLLKHDLLSPEAHIQNNTNGH